jgi:hypothetical protein
LQVSEVRMVRMMKVVKVKPQADRVPRGMDLAGDNSSPDRFAPAIIPLRRYSYINSKDEIVPYKNRTTPQKAKLGEPCY